jgi:hypothetical protein
VATNVDLLNGYMTAALNALAGGDYATALSNALAAQGMIAILPKASRSQGTGGGEQAASWDAAGIDNFIRRLRQQYGASLGVQSSPVLIAEPVPIDNGDEYSGGGWGGWQ